MKSKKNEEPMIDETPWTKKAIPPKLRLYSLSARFELRKAKIHGHHIRKLDLPDRDHLPEEKFEIDEDAELRKRFRSNMFHAA
mmetsp:Transcript_5660/g.4807  ORF Transcript_5660/g.4807 Transcript_5660/m.4807 type:complete len:83 (-) Transcript_5660:335-583(-)